MQKKEPELEPHLGWGFCSGERAQEPRTVSEAHGRGHDQEAEGRPGLLRNPGKGVESVEQDDLELGQAVAEHGIPPGAYCDLILSQKNKAVNALDINCCEALA